jgi:hypothetical protein
MDSNEKNLLKALIRECVIEQNLIIEREFYSYSAPDGQGARFPSGLKLFGKENPQSLEDVGLIHSLVTPAYRTLFGGGLDADGNPIETGGLFGLVSSLAGVVTGLLGRVFTRIGSLGGSAASGISQDVSSGQSRRFTRNITSGQQGIREYAGREGSEYIRKVTADARQIVSDYLEIKKQTDIDSLGRTINEIFYEYDPSGIEIPSPEALLREAMSSTQEPELQNLTPDQLQQLQRDIEVYTMDNVKAESKRVFLDILAQLKDYSGLAGGPALASDPTALNAFDQVFQRASEQISFN